MNTLSETMPSQQYLVARNPATEAELGRVAMTPPDAVAGVVDRARKAQADWGTRSWSARRAILERWWLHLAGRADRWADAICAEVGKPRGEAMAEVVVSLDAIRWTVLRGGKALRDERIGADWQRFLFIPGGRLRHRPIGVVGMIGTWNYPILLNAPVIAQALAAGNAVVWKPSELALLVGERLQQSLDEVGIPGGLASAVYGGADVGRALVDADLDKGVFTGGVENGRRVLERLASRGIPATAELAGFDPAVVLPDAPFESTIRALTWGAFVGCGQTCVAVKRMYVVGDPAPWVEALAERARSLRVGDPSRPDVDVGPMISETARDRFEERIRAAVAAGATVRAGGERVAGPGSFIRPMVLSAGSDGPESALAGVFGPVVVVRGVPDVEAAVAAANRGDYGLAASVWGRDMRAAREVAGRIVAGLVTVNEAVTPTGHASAPFGGTKASGYGRTHGPLGLREFTQPQAVLVRRPGGFRPQLFPYSSRMETILAWYRRFFHRPRG
jgi:acyl-CoA reductase-like NAD-dependent aldehyde dehydrogenase